MSTITNRTGHERCQQSTVLGLVQCIQNALEKVVGLLELVPEEQIGLAELKFLEFVSLHDGNAEHIGGSKKPATARASLVGDWGAFEGDAEVEDLLIADRSRWSTQTVLCIVGRQGQQCQAILYSVSLEGEQMEGVMPWGLRAAPLPSLWSLPQARSESRGLASHLHHLAFHSRHVHSQWALEVNEVGFDAAVQQQKQNVRRP